ncbi:hypothetical protein ACHAPT_006251 [Fusarium lateritium]
MEEYHVFSVKFLPEELEWPDAGSLTSLNAIYRELCRIDDLDRRLMESRYEGDGWINDWINDWDDGWCGSWHDGQKNTTAEQANRERTALREAIRQLDDHRKALRQRAMDLSRGTLMGLSILDLPMDILVQVFSYFQHQQVRPRHNGSISWPGKIPSMSNAIGPLLTLYNARQVCRLFNTTASLFFCPFLNLKLDQESLDRAEILLANPSIARGVVGIQVSLEYRPVELAEDLALFAKARKRDLAQMESAMEWWAEGGCSPIEEDLEPSPYRVAADSYWAIVDAWNHFLGIKDESVFWDSDEEEEGVDENQDGGVRGPNDQVQDPVEDISQNRDPSDANIEVENRSEHEGSRSTDLQDGRSLHKAPEEEEEKYEPDEAALEYYNILCSSHKEYAKLQKSQHDLLQTHSFVNTLSSLTSRLNRPLALRIHGSLDRREICFQEDQDSLYDILTNKAELAKFLLTTHQWEDMDAMDEMRGHVTLAQAKVLSELPIAMHKAGVLLRHLTVGYLPGFCSFSQLCPGENEAPDSPGWRDLSAACQHLETFQGEWGSHPVRKWYLDPKDSVYIEKYINAVLSGDQFEHVNITLSHYGLNNGNGKSVAPPSHMPGVLENVQWPRIRRVRIHNLSFHQEELDRFCNALGPKAENIGFVSINLLDGSWLNTLDILRDKMADSRNKGTCQVWMADLRGGELGQRTLSPEWLLEKVKSFRDYVKGELEENPAAKDHLGEEARL